LLKQAGHRYESVCIWKQKLNKTQSEMKDFTKTFCASIVSPVQFRLLPPFLFQGFLLVVCMGYVFFRGGAGA
jgi:hypothetical protein